jgi:hypothetical protein
VRVARGRGGWGERGISGEAEERDEGTNGRRDLVEDEAGIGVLFLRRRTSDDARVGRRK